MCWSLFLECSAPSSSLKCSNVVCKVSVQTSLLVKVSMNLSSRTLVTVWTIAHQAPLSMGFSRQEYWSELPFPFPGDLPDPGIEPRSPALQADSLPTELQGKILTILVTYCFITNHPQTLQFKTTIIIYFLKNTQFPDGSVEKAHVFSTWP